MKLGVLYISFLFVAKYCDCFINIYGRCPNRPVVKNEDVGDPLFLTPYIKAGKLEEGRTLANATSLVGNVESYSGFLTVNEKYNSNLFFWFFPSVHDRQNAPVILWLQGGPGASSMFGLFGENGPYYVTYKNTVALRRYHWSSMASLLYIDNPVGTGYSFTENDRGYATKETDVAKDLYNAMQQFFTLFSEFRSHRFFVSGESYAGKYVPALSYMIHTQNPSSQNKINLAGLAIGNGLCDPEHMLHYGEYLYQLGLVDTNVKEIFEQKEKEAVEYIKAQKYIQAFEVFDSLLNGDLTGEFSFFTNVTGLTNYYNYIENKENIGGDIDCYIQKPEVRKAIHVGNATFHTDKKVEMFLKADIMQSVKDVFEVLVENYPVLIYNGQLDIIVAYPLTVNFLKNLKWSGADEYKKAERHIWKVDNVVAGYCKTAKNLTEVVVRDAGHMVPMDQPKVAYDLITRFIYNRKIVP